MIALHYSSPDWQEGGGGKQRALKEGWIKIELVSLQSSQISVVKSLRRFQFCFLYILEKKLWVKTVSTLWMHSLPAAFESSSFREEQLWRHNGAWSKTDAFAARSAPALHTGPGGYRRSSLIQNANNPAQAGNNRLQAREFERTQPLWAAKQTAAVCSPRK